jgi:hypothetical protein
MARLLITYDLRKPDFDYDPLYAELRSLGAKHIQDSVWAVQTDSSPEEVYDQLWLYLHNDKDRLLVTDTGAFKAINSISKFSSV